MVLVCDGKVTHPWSVSMPKAGARQRTTRESLLGSVCGLGFLVAFESFYKFREFGSRVYDIRPY